MSDEKPMGQVIQIDEARIRDHLGEMVRGTVEERLNAMLDAEAQTSYVGLDVTSAARLGRIPELAVTSVRCRPAPGTSISRSRSCGGRPSRLRSSNATGGGRARWRRRSSRCIWRGFRSAGWKTSPRRCGVRG